MSDRTIAELVIGGLLAMCILVSSFEWGAWRTHQGAIDAGVGEWVCDSQTGETSWHWIIPEAAKAGGK